MARRRHRHRWVKDDAALCWRCACGEIVTEEEASNHDRYGFWMPAPNKAWETRAPCEPVEVEDE